LKEKTSYSGRNCAIEKENHKKKASSPIRQVRGEH